MASDTASARSDAKQAGRPTLMASHKGSNVALTSVHKPAYVPPIIERPAKAHLLPKTLRDASLAQTASNFSRSFSLPALSLYSGGSSAKEGASTENSTTSFVDLFVGRAGRAQIAQPADDATDIAGVPSISADPATAAIGNAQNTALLEGPVTWFNSFFQAKAASTEGLAEEDNDNPKTKEDRLLDDADKSAADEPEWSRLKERYETPRLPIVFCHGLFGFDKIGPELLPALQISYWRGIEEAMEAAGCEVVFTQVPMSASIEERARVLANTISEKLPGREINLIGHSMGGLDARFLVSQLKPVNFKVKSICTVSTPHRGSPAADYFIDGIIGKNNVKGMLNALSFFQVPGGGKAFEDLTTYNMERFNIETPDDPNVAYFSYGSRCQPSLLDPFRISWSVIYDIEGDNDGLVSVSSAKYGTYCGTLENVNHADTCGWTGPVRYKYAELVGKPIKYKAVSFYLSIAERLAKA